MLFVGPVDNQEHSILNVIESLEGFLKRSNHLGELVGSGLTYMCLVNYQDKLDLLIDVEKSLDEKRVGDLVLLSLVIFKPRTIVESHVL